MSIFQFTPLREGRLRVEFTHAEQLISIHAPPRGATGDDGKQIAVVDISIHAPPRGATVPGKPVSLGTEHFNSRPSARGDRAEQARIRAQKLFQFTPLREGRLALAVGVNKTRKFQFTPLREGRL